ncbi:MAG: very short patch repair endonuclease [Thermoleophilia bacterium]|nr:very short patch repair endonuclease [Thermoleophilia bacterium]
MSRVPRRDTKPELAVRSALHRLGLRFRVDRSLLEDRRRKVDIVFGPARVAVFVDGCFWHNCPVHGTRPRANEAYWREKLRRNQERDRESDELLRADGWLVVRVWEHEDPETAAQNIAHIVAGRRE